MISGDQVLFLVSCPLAMLSVFLVFSAYFLPPRFFRPSFLPSSPPPVFCPLVFSGRLFSPRLLRLFSAPSFSPAVFSPLVFSARCPLPSFSPHVFSGCFSPALFLMHASECLCALRICLPGRVLCTLLQKLRQPGEMVGSESASLRHDGAGGVRADQAGGCAGVDRYGLFSGYWQGYSACARGSRREGAFRTRRIIVL